MAKTKKHITTKNRCGVSAAPLWACVKDSPHKALQFLQNNGYQNAWLEKYTCSASKPMNGALSTIIKSGRPVVIFTMFNGAALAYREKIEYMDIDNPTGGFPKYIPVYRSFIHYYTGSGGDMRSENSYFHNRMSYIAY